MALTIEEVKQDMNLVNDFILQNKYLITTTINKQFPNLTNNTDYEDILQTANMALYKSVCTFDPGKNTKFKTHAINNIVGYIKNHLRDNNTSIGLKVPPSMRMAYRKYLYLSGTQLSDEQIAKEMKMSTDEINEMVKTMSAVTCFDDILTNDEDNSMSVENAIAVDYSLEDDVIEKAILIKKKNLINKYLSHTHYAMVDLAEQGYNSKDILVKLRLKRVEYALYAQQIKLAFEYMRDDINSEVITKVKNIKEELRGDDMKIKKSISLKEAASIVANWAKENIGEIIKVNEILDQDNCRCPAAGATEIKRKAVEQLLKEGYITTYVGNSFKIRNESDSLEEVTSTVESIEQPSKGSLEEYMKEIIEAISVNYDKVLSAISTNVNTNNENYNFRVENRVIDSTSIDSLLSAIKLVHEMANTNGKKIEATILLKEIN